jgi:hypothetical protein
LGFEYQDVYTSGWSEIQVDTQLGDAFTAFYSNAPLLPIRHVLKSEAKPSTWLMQSRTHWVLTYDKGKTAPEGWTHPEALAQDVSILGERKRLGFDFPQAAQPLSGI